MSANLKLASPDSTEYHILTDHRYCKSCGEELVLKLAGDFNTANGKPRAFLVCPMWMCGHTGHECKYERKKWWHRRRCVWCGGRDYYSEFF